MISLAAIAALGSLAATGIGSYVSAEQNAEAEGELRAQRNRERAEHNRLLMRGYVNRSENQQLLRRLQEMQRLSYERARATNVVAGGTDAHLAAMQQQAAKIVSDTAGNIAARSDQYEDKVRAEDLASSRNFSNQMFGIKRQKAQNVANAASQASRAMAGIAAAGGGETNPFEGIAEEVGGAAVASAPSTPVVTAVPPATPATKSEVAQQIELANKLGVIDPSILFGIAGGDASLRK